MSAGIQIQDVLDEQRISRSLEQLGLGKYCVQVLPTVDSTNSYVMQHLEQLPGYAVVIADRQTHGRGCYNKQWSSDAGVDLLTSILFYVPLKCNYSSWPLMMALAVNRTLKHFGIENYIKWPNDICLNDTTKISGILLESGIKDHKRFIIVGIGIDNPTLFARETLLLTLLQQIEHIITEYHASGNILLLQEALNNCIHYQRHIGIYQNDVLIASGKHIGFDPSGAVLIDDGQQVRAYASGTLRFEVIN